MVEQFLDTAEVAAQTSRIALSSVVLQMRQVQRQFERTEHPECSETIYEELSIGMEAAVQGFTDFLGEREWISTYLALSSQHFWNAFDALQSHVTPADIRLSDTAFFIWGGNSPNEATATAMVETPANFITNLTPSILAQTRTSPTQFAPSPTLTQIYSPTPSRTPQSTPRLMASLSASVSSTPTPRILCQIFTRQNINARTLPSLEAPIFITIASGTILNVIGQETNSLDGRRWFLVESTDRGPQFSGVYVRDDASFVGQLTECLHAP